jgi:ABC-type sugar transport system ATPase subunit
MTLLSVRDVHKRFPGVHALRGVSLDVAAGEVHALVGENGAGKSTLMHVLAGVHRPDQGQVLLDGQPVTIADEQAAQRLGIAIVYQERSLFPLLDVAENVYAGRQPVRRLGRIDRRALDAGARRVLAELDVDVDPRTLVGQLPPALQQMVEIAKALSLDPRVLILDEPTAALTETETRALFRAVQRLEARGIAVIYISHRLEEIFEIARRVTVLRDGSEQGTVAIADTDPADLVRRMVGRDVAPTAARVGSLEEGRPALEVRGLVDPPDGPARPLLKDVSLSVRRGEVLALAGLAGAGRTELALSIFGARPRGAGDILVDGRSVSPRSPAEAIAAGVGYLSEDRKELGLFLEMSLADNVAAAALPTFGRVWLDDGRVRDVAAEQRTRLRIASRDVDQPVRALSGGNQQKVALAKWLLVEPRVLIVDEPTRGVDVGAKAEVHALLLELAARGTAVVVISSDLPEVLALGDRVAVMREGRLVAVLGRGEATEETVMHYAARAARRQEELS